MTEQEEPTAAPAERTLKDAAAELEDRRADALAMGGPDLVERQHSLGKLTVRERLDLLFDPGTFVESGLLAGAVDSPQSQGKRTPADGCITGVGLVDGRKVMVIAYDFTVLAGSIGQPRHPGPPAAGLRLQIVRLPRRAAGRLHARGHDRGPADHHRRLDARQQRPCLSRLDYAARGFRAFE